MAQKLWLGWSSRRVGLIAMITFLVLSLATIWNIHQRSISILAESVKTGLLVAAKAIATVVDPELHQTFQNRAQESSPAYQKQIGRLAQMRSAVDPKGMIKFVYTCVSKADGIYIVLDDTPDGDADHDGVDDKAHIMEAYPDACEALRFVLKHGKAAVNSVPYTDKWGSFMSGYAPVFDSHERVIAAVGVDLALQDYQLQMSSIKMVSLLSSIGALSLSMIVGLEMAHYHRRLQGAIPELVTLGDAAMTASKAKSDFLASMSHELRTPMHAIIGHADLLGGTALDSSQRDSLNTIQRAADSLLGMITDILDFSALDSDQYSIEKKPVDLESLLDDVCVLFDAEAKAKGIKLQPRIDAECASRILTDRMRLRQIIRHLISNAIKFTTKGSVTIKVSCPSPGKIQLSVSDTGQGISSERQKLLFEAFGLGDSTSTRKHGGMGIGLAICKRICDVMHGRIWLESTEGQGSTFHVELPAPAAPDPGAVWLVTKNGLTTILVRSVVEKMNRKLHLVEECASVSANGADIVLVDLSSVVISKKASVRTIGLNADEHTGRNDALDAVLDAPVKPAALRVLLEG